MNLHSVLDVSALVEALALPAGCRVDQRVPKKLLLENGASTASDKRLINEGVEEIQWIAALKPNTIGVADYRDELREYLEIAVLAVTLRGLEDKPAKADRLAELMHRAVPYPVVLLLQAGARLSLSMAHKRWAQNEAGKVVLDGDLTSVLLPDDALSPETFAAFRDNIALSRQPQSTLIALYQGWIERVQALKAAKLTGVFKIAGDPELASARREALAEYVRLEAEATRLRTQAGKEKQLARQIELNLALKAVLKQITKLKESL